MTQVTPSQYTINLSTVTAITGLYELRLTAAGSGIQDLLANPMTADLSTVFLVDRVIPVATIATVESPRSTPVTIVTVPISEFVTGLDLSDFSLTRNGVAVPLTGVPLVVRSASFYELDLSSVTALQGITFSL